ncbi:MAG: nitroreductase family protein [Alistipes sp.]|nr:nitroreductase family protein [Alistipes sp.]
MADNYLGKKMEDHYANTATTAKRTVTLSRLLTKNRSHRGYDTSFKVREDQLRRIIEVNTKIPSASNRQILRFRPVLHNEAEKVLPHIRLGGALPHLNLPKEGCEPEAFIIICSTIAEDKYVDIDLGISAQSMLLQAAEIGLNGICIGAFDHEAIKSGFDLKYDPLLIVAIGRGTDNIKLVEIGADQSTTYYREDDTHYVPKIRCEDLIIK